mgnify:CR=1 FL=1
MSRETADASDNDSPWKDLESLIEAGDRWVIQTEDGKLRLARLSPEKIEVLGEVELLSDRELEVFSLLGQGMTTRRIAEVLRLSPKTVGTHREHIKHKLAIESAAELAQRATRWVETGRTG